MRFLIDNALSPKLANGLQLTGPQAIHVVDCGLATAPDEIILEYATEEHRIIVSADTDFASLLAARVSSSPSLILFRGATPRRSASQVDLIIRHLPAIENDLEAGSIVVIEPGRLRIRRLPLLFNKYPSSDNEE